MAARVLSVPFGEPATALLARLVTDLRGGDPLAPITVTVPSATAGTTLRRRLATTSPSGGVVGVTVQSMPELAARLAGADAAELPPVVLRGHLRAALRDVTDGPLAHAAASPATERALERTLAELADLDEEALDALADRGGVPAATVSLARDVRRRLGPDAARAGTVRAAADAVAAGRGPLDDVGPVVVHLPRRLVPAELDLLAVLARRGHPVAVTVGTTGDPVADELVGPLLTSVATALRVPVEAAEVTAAPAVDELVRTPDPAEEAAVATRLVVGALAGGTDAERIAVLYRVRDPYAALLREQLDAAGVPHHARSVRTLAQSVAGRVLLGALALPDTGYRRSEIVAWWRSGPVLDLAGSRRTVPVARWDRVAREAGVVCGLDQWQQRLAQAAERRREQLASRPPPDPDEPERVERHLPQIEALAAAVDALGRRLAPPADRTWSGWSRWACDLLADMLDTGDPTWSAEETEALDAVRRAIRGLAQLDPIDPAPDLRRFRAALERELDAPARPHGVFGHGVAVAPLFHAVGADFDLAVVVGAAEGAFPPHGSDDALVPDRERRLAGGALAPRSRNRSEERRDLFAALAAARRRVLVAPRSDPRAQRERQPAAAFLDAAGARAGRLVATDELDELRRSRWFTDVASFEWWPASKRPEQVAFDIEVATLLAEHRAGRPVVGAAATQASPALARGLEAALARRQGTFDAWSGNVGSREDLLAGFDRPRSPTGLEHYATCPFRFFLGQTLGVSAVDDPTDLDEISPRDSGSLIHAALERFIDERGIGKPPEEPWSADDRQRLVAVANELADHYEALGRTGRPLLWGVRREQLRRDLLALLDDDDRVRASLGSSPAAMEHRFGVDEGDDAVVLDLGDGRSVQFRGFIDRIDRTADGGVLVLDYKSGSDWGYRGLDADITDRGRKLQLGVYALAARQHLPEATSVDTRYWFIRRGRGGPPLLHGGPFDEAAETRFRDVVTTMIDGVVGGRFPANPGDEEWAWGRYVHQHCRHCDFDRVCPTTRGWRWQQLRAEPELADYVALAEGEP
jgi:ATP-dependent helicase/nuclease subunit B